MEVVTVALDTDVEAARPFHEAAHPTHPSLVDPGHVTVGLFGMTNVPFAIWIDEDGTIVRGPEPAHPKRPAYKDRAVPADATPEQRERILVVRALRVDAERYVAALHDWVAHGAQSRFALSPDEVVRRSRPRPIEEATAAAHFAIGQTLHDAGAREDAIAHFREAHRLQPANWTYRRDAWSLTGPEHETVYGTSWMSEVMSGLRAAKYCKALSFGSL